MGRQSFTTNTARWKKGGQYIHTERGLRLFQLAHVPELGGKISCIMNKDGTPLSGDFLWHNRSDGAHPQVFGLYRLLRAILRARKFYEELEIPTLAEVITACAELGIEHIDLASVAEQDEPTQRALERLRRHWARTEARIVAPTNPQKRTAKRLMITIVAVEVPGTGATELIIRTTDQLFKQLCERVGSVRRIDRHLAHYSVVIGDLVEQVGQVLDRLSSQLGACHDLLEDVNLDRPLYDGLRTSLLDRLTDMYERDSHLLNIPPHHETCLHVRRELASAITLLQRNDPHQLRYVRGKIGEMLTHVVSAQAAAMAHELICALDICKGDKTAWQISQGANRAMRALRRPLTSRKIRCIPLEGNIKALTAAVRLLKSHVSAETPELSAGALKAVLQQLRTV